MTTQLKTCREKPGLGRPVERRRGPSTAARLNRLDDSITILTRYLPMPLPEVALRLGVSERQIRDRLKASKGQRGLPGTGLFQLFDGRVHYVGADDRL